MRILQLNSVYHYGSTGSIVETIHSFLLEKGIDSFVIYGRGSKSNSENVYKCNFEILAKMNALISKITGLIYSGNYFATFLIIRKIKRIKPSVVHIHNLNDHYVNEYILLKYLAKHKYKVILTLHSEQMYTGTCGYSLGCEKWKAGGCDNNCPHIYLSALTNVDKTKKAFYKLSKTYSMFDQSNIKIIGCTPWLMNNAKKSILLNNFQCTYVLNGGNENVFKRKLVNRNKLFGVNANAFVILFVCPRLDDEVKGFSFIEELSKQLVNNEFIYIIGKSTKNINLPNNVIYLGEINDRNLLSEYYSGSNCTIMLSKNECFPMVIVESLLCGTPVAAFNSIGPVGCYNAKYVKFSSYGDVSELYKTIKSFNVSPSDVESYANSIVSSNSMCNKYLEEYLWKE